MKTISILLALINSLAAGVIIAASLPGIQVLRPAASLWSATRVACSAGIISAGILTWIAATRATDHHLLFIAGLFLVTLGTALGVWTIHLALRNGRIDDSMFIYGGSLLVQGATSLWNLLTPGKSPSAI